MSRPVRFLIGLAMLVGLLAVRGWTATYDTSPAQIDYCPPHDRGNPWCGQP